MEGIHFPLYTQTFDPGVANDLIDETFESVGWMVEDDDGNTIQDLAQAKAKTWMVFQNHHVIPESAVARLRSPRAIETEIRNRGVSQNQLYLEVFGAGAPGAVSSDDLSPEEEQVCNLLKSQLWGWAGSGRTSHFAKGSERPWISPRRGQGGSRRTQGDVAVPDR